jgi:beta-glucosidase
VDGIPSHANKWLLKDVLRKEWGYKGMIVSDYYGVDQLFNKHFVCSDANDAAETAFNAGVQFEFPQGNLFKQLPKLLKKGKIKIKDIDMAVHQVLTFKFELGLFENPYVDEKEAIAVTKSPDHAKIALRAAHESLVLLKNDGLLPLKKGKYRKIAVIGPCAKDLWFGGYSGEPFHKVSILDGIKAKAGDGTEVLFAQGCKITTNTTLSYFNWKYDEIVFASREDNLKLIKEAVKTASDADLIILAIGENEHLCREAWAKNHIGDNMTLDLFGEQGELADAITALDKPVILYLMNGRPLSINKLAVKVPAIIEGWFMGQETGTAAADIIFGDVNPSGKLTITFPKSAGQLPMYYNHKPSAQYMDYISQDINPLFCFGYGLSYTRFSYSEPVMKKKIIKKSETAFVKVDVTNTGKVKGDEIVQLYIRDLVSTVTRPVKELKGFARISLNPGETRKVTFEITPEKLAFHNIAMDFVTEPGMFEIMVGSSSADADLKKTHLIVK